MPVIEKKWGCGCYEHNGKIFPCKLDAALNPKCFRTGAVAAPPPKD